MLKIRYGHEEPDERLSLRPRQTWTLFALAGASVIFEKRGVLNNGATWKRYDKECTEPYHYAADLIQLWRKHQ